VTPAHVGISRAIQRRERIDWIDFEDSVSSKGGDFQGVSLPMSAEILHWSRGYAGTCDFMLSDAKQARVKNELAACKAPECQRA